MKDKKYKATTRGYKEFSTIYSKNVENLKNTIPNHRIMLKTFTQTR
jgi:hypothetical protein